MKTSNIMRLGWQKKVLEHRMEDGTLMFDDMPAVVKIERQDLISILKNSFYAGAKHVTDALVYEADLDEGDELTVADTHKLDAIMREIQEYFIELASRGDAGSKLNRHNGAN